MTEIMDQVTHWLDGISGVYILPAIAILPLFAFPVSVLLILAGMKFGVVYGLLIAMTGVAINDTLAYWLARTFFRGPILRLLERKKIKVPVIPENQEIRFIALLRIAPGSPLFIQSYLLGLANVNYWRYIIISVPIQSIHVAAIIIFGDAIFEGEIGMIIFAVSLAIVMGIIFRMIHTRQKNRNAGETAEAPISPDA